MNDEEEVLTTIKKGRYFSKDFIDDAEKECEEMTEEEKEIEFLRDKYVELKEGKEAEEKEKLEKRLWKTCQLCGSEFKTYDEAETHYQTDHSERYGDNFIEFLSAYAKAVLKIRSELDEKADKILEEDLKKEVFHRALIEPQKTKDQLSKFTLDIARSEAQEINGEIEKGYCRVCNLGVPFVKKEDEEGNIIQSDNSVEDHWNTQIELGSEPHRKLREYYRKMEALSKGKNPYKESEQLSKDSTKKEKVDTALMKSTTESSIETKEELTKSNLPDKNLLKIFSEEVYSELSEKQKKEHKLARKTR